MKRKIMIFCAILFIVFSLTGCTQYVKDKNGAPIKEPTTGQTLASNILCKPTNKNVIKTYKKYKVNIDKLPDCPKFTPASGKYSGLWNTLFIKPLSYLIIQIGKIFGNYGLAIIIVTILIRLVIFPISKKSAMQSEGMKDAQKDLKKIEKKYNGRDSQEDQMKKAQETMAIYKKYGINPMSGCLFAFIQMPLFFAFLESMNRLPIVFEGKFLGLNLGMSPYVKIFGDSFSFDKLLGSFGNGSFVYLLLPVLVGLATFFSFKLNSGVSSGNAEQEKQMKTMMNVMLGLIVFTSFTMPTSIILYWIVGSIFTIVQAEVIRRMKNGSRGSEKRIKK